MNPVILIATHGRKQITTATIVALQKQTTPAAIVLVVSDSVEALYYLVRFPEVHVCIRPNQPLGAKWQGGVDYCKWMNPDPLIILGSDDMLEKDFVAWTMNTMTYKNVDFIGFNQWMIYNPMKEILYEFHYAPSMPLGGGRCYSKDLLKWLGYRLFDPRRTKLLDDLGWDATRSRNANTHISLLPKLLAIKGNWIVMNPLEITLKHPNARLIQKWTGKEALDLITQKFAYDPKAVLQHLPGR